MKKIKISNNFLRSFISHIANIRIEVCGTCSDIHQDYDAYIEDARLMIDEHKEQSYAKLGIEYILTCSDIDINEYSDDYPYDSGQLKGILKYAYQKLWPDSKLPESPPLVEIIEMDLYEWRKSRANLNMDNSDTK